MKEDNLKKFNLRFKKILAEYLGVETEDIDDDDSLVDDLHMGPAEITDFMQTLENAGINIDDVDLSEIETVSDMVDSLVSKEFVS